jgi:hypothetical protein
LNRTARNSWVVFSLRASAERSVLKYAAGVRAGRRQDLVSELVVRLVLRDPVADPLPERAGPDVAEELPVHHEEVGPLVRPVLDEPVAAHEPVDQLVALDPPVPPVGGERQHLLRRRRQAGQVQVRAADERGVVGQVARLDPHLFELRVHQFVDGVVDRPLDPLEAGAVPHDHHGAGGVRALVPG